MNTFKPGLPGRRASHSGRWERFDSLPREYKEILWDAHSGSISLNTRNATPAYVRAELAEAQAKACRETYGPTHPQAKRDAVEESLLELGLL